MRKMIWAAVSIALSVSAFACSSSSNDGTTSCGLCENGDDDYQQPDSGGDATTDACPVQSYPTNSAECPAAYSFSYAGEACSPAGLQCWYPGAGDVGANGCAAPGLLKCEFPDSGIGSPVDAAIFDDAGDSGIGYWITAQ